MASQPHLKLLHYNHKSKSRPTGKTHDAILLWPGYRRALAVLMQHAFGARSGGNSNDPNPKPFPLPRNLLNYSSWFMIRFVIEKFSSVPQKGEHTEGDMAKVSDLLGSRSDIYSLREDMTAHDAARYLRERR